MWIRLFVRQGSLEHQQVERKGRVRKEREGRKTGREREGKRVGGKGRRRERGREAEGRRGESRRDKVGREKGEGRKGKIDKSVSLLFVKSVSIATSHLKGCEPSSCWDLEPRCLHSPNLVSDTWRVPRDALVLGQLWKSGIVAFAVSEGITILLVISSSSRGNNSMTRGKAVYPFFWAATRKCYPYFVQVSPYHLRQSEQLPR